MVSRGPWRKAQPASDDSFSGPTFEAMRVAGANAGREARLLVRSPPSAAAAGAVRAARLLVSLSHDQNQNQDVKNSGSCTSKVVNTRTFCYQVRVSAGRIGLPLENDCTFTQIKSEESDEKISQNKSSSRCTTLAGSTRR